MSVAEPSKKTLLWDTVGLGLLLWAIGYGLWMAFQAVIAPRYTGWCVLVVLVPIMGYAASRRLQHSRRSIKYLLKMSVVWLALSAVANYKFVAQNAYLVGYRHLDVALYYALTFLMPLLVGLRYRHLDSNS